MSVDIRPPEPQEIEAFVEAMGGPFFFDLPADEGKRRERIERFERTFERERALCAMDGDRIVGTLGSFSLKMTVPGGSVPCAGTTMVTVQPTHRRRGILRSILSRHLADALALGEPIAALWASDSAIYGRFGYGLATLDASFEIQRAHASFHRNVVASVPVRQIDKDEARSLLPQMYSQVQAERPGMFVRSNTWWDARMHDDPERRDGATALRFAVAEQGGTAGYVVYRMKSKWTDDHGAAEVRVEELIARDGGTEAGLWGFLAAHDLSEKVVAAHRPPDDTIFDLLAAPRRASPRFTDGLWVRIIKIADALQNRGYRVPGAFVFEVSDPLGMSEGRFRIESDGNEAHCEVSSSPADIVMDIEDLGACYLGWSRFASLARSGRVSGDAEAISLADLMFGWSPAPWCPEVF